MQARHSLLYFLAVVAPRTCMFAVLFVLARRLSVDEVGLFVLVITLGEMLEMVAANWIRIYIHNREAGNARIRSLRAGRLLLLTGVATAGALALVPPISLLVAGARSGEFMLALGLYVIAFGLLRLSLGVAQALRRHRVFAQIEAVRTITILVIIAGLLAFEPKSFLLPSLALSLSTTLVALWGTKRVSAFIDRPRLTRYGLRSASRFGMPMIGDTLLSFLLVSLDRLVLNDTLGPAAVGIYGVAYALGRQPIDFIVGPLNNLAAPALFAARAQDGDERARQMQSGMMLTLYILCIAMFIGVALLREPLVHLLLKPELWDETIWLMPAINSAACLFTFRSYLYDNVFYLFGKTALKLKIAVPIGIASAAMTIGLIWAYGLKGAAGALFLGAAVALVGSIVGSRMFFRFKAPLGMMAGVTVVALIAAVALHFSSAFARPYGNLAEIIAGFIAFSIVYALGLRLIGISVAGIVGRPWAPLLQDGPASRA